MTRPQGIKETKPICQICGNSRYVEKCHIIPRCTDRVLKMAKRQEANILYLCPNHHKYFDKGLLTEEEFALIESSIRHAIEELLPVVRKVWSFPLKKDSQEKRDKVINAIFNPVEKETLRKLEQNG